MGAPLALEVDGDLLPVGPHDDGTDIVGPQYYSYAYTPTGNTAYSAIAQGDLDGDGQFSTFTRLAAVDATTKRIAKSASIQEVSPEE